MSGCLWLYVHTIVSRSYRWQMDIWYTCSLRLSSLLLSVCVSVCMRALLHVYTRGLVHKCTFPWNCGVLWVLMPGVLCVFPVCLNVGCGSCGVSHNNVSVMCFICTCVFLCGIFVWLHVCTNICAFPCVCAPVFVCVCVFIKERSEAQRGMTCMCPAF